MAVSITNNAMKKPFTFSWMACHEHRIASGVKNVVSKTRNKLMPSTPR